MVCNAAQHVRACHNIPPHVHLSPFYVYVPIDLSNLYTVLKHSCPDCELFNMSPLGTNLSRLRHHLAAGAPEIGVHSVSLFALNILRLCKRTVYQTLDTLESPNVQYLRGGTENPV